MDTNNKSVVIVGAVVLVLALVGGFVFISSKNKAPVTQSPSVPTPSEVSTRQDVKAITVEGDEYSFSPSSLSLTEGENIALTLKNTGNISHDLVINELSVSTGLVSPGESKTVSFTASKTGNFVFYCSVGTHKDLGMEGKVQVK